MTHINLYNIPGLTPLTLFILVLWVIPWKGWALWKAAQKNSVWWFIALLIINTIGILDILYIFVFSEKKIKSAK
ncbi:MAG: DUF5652 family protein [Patescibacteria group bacterium]|nr:DUF5652 family protein [Patescibacteria group bacterium]MDE2144388.1 hypothetical protein [Patescibacteria group bacterium]